MIRRLPFVLLVCAISLPLHAQLLGLVAPAAPAASSAAAKPPAAPVAIPIDQVALEAEDDSARIHEMSIDLDDDEAVTDVSQALIPLTRDVNARLGEVHRILVAKPSVAAVHALEPGWQQIARRANDATKELTRRAVQLTRLIEEINRLDERWAATQKVALAAQAPQAVTDRIGELNDLIDKTRTAAAARQGEVLALQAKSASLAARANDTLEQLAAASQRASNALFSRDSLPVWSGGFWSSAIAAVTGEGTQSLQSQFSDLSMYLQAAPEEPAVHILVSFALIALMYIARRKTKGFLTDEPEMVQAAEMFHTPIATALLLASFIGYWFYAEPPQILPRLLGVLGIVPTLLVVRRLIEKHLYPLLYALTGFFFLDLIRSIVSVSAPMARLVFVVEILGALAFVGWFFASSRQRDDRPWTKRHTWRWLHGAALVGLILLGFTLLANLVGYQGLSTLIGAAMLRGAYFAILLYAVTRVVQGLILGSFYVKPLTFLAMVRQHRRLLTDRITILFDIGAVGLWVYVVLNIVGFWDVASKAALSFLDTDLTVGSFSISLGKIAAFAIAILAASWTARLVTFILDEEIYPKITLARGMSYVISTMLRYAILLVGVVVALASLGIDMTKFTILAGAFSVGLGFGMQNIVNNFVSGLIVLFERPVKVGDVVQFGDVIGRVQRIGIRASVIRSGNGAEVIIPNGTLISSNVTNWTFSSATRRVDVPIQAALVADPAQVKKILLDVASRFKEAAESPPPQALLTKLGPDALEFELRVWTEAASDWANLKSDLTSAATDELRQAGIAFK